LLTEQNGKPKEIVVIPTLKNRMRLKENGLIKQENVILQLTTNGYLYKMDNQSQKIKIISTNHVLG
jgi:hypothetical protein